MNRRNLIKTIFGGFFASMVGVKANPVFHTAGILPLEIGQVGKFIWEANSVSFYVKTAQDRWEKRNWLTN